MIDIHMPRLSDTMEEGAIAVWHKKPGDRVSAGDVLVEIETDKAIMEYEAYDSGVLHEILVPEGDQAAIGATIARIDDGSAQPAPVPSPAPEEPAAVSPAEPGDRAEPDARAATASDSGERLRATPLVRRLAREHDIDLTGVPGSGPGGRIVRADIEHALADGHKVDAAPAVTAPPEAPRDPRASTSVPFDKMRQVISRRLSENSSTTPHFAVTAVADVEELLALRHELNSRLEPVGRPRVSVNDFIVRASAVALREHPGINASYSAEGRGATLQHGRVNIGIAVASDTGLVVPVIDDADQKTVSQLASESKELASLAQSHRLSASQLSGGTFTISNLGMYGVEHFTAIINPPESAILAVGGAIAEPCVRDGEIVVRHRMRLTLSADHRIIDGALAARFLAALTALLENPLGIIA